MRPEGGEKDEILRQLGVEEGTAAARGATIVIARARSFLHASAVTSSELRKIAAAQAGLAKTLDRLERQVRDLEGLVVTGGKPRIDFADVLAEDVKRMRRRIDALAWRPPGAERPGPKAWTPDAELAVGNLAGLWRKHRPDSRVTVSNTNAFAQFVRLVLGIEDPRRAITKAKSLGLL